MPYFPPFNLSLLIQAQVMFFQIMLHFFQKAVPHARLPIFDQLSSVQSRILFWKSPKHDQAVPKLVCPSFCCVF